MKMIRWRRTGRVLGKIPAAIQWAKEIAEYCNKYVCPTKGMPP
jgi:hypothetical protein